MLVKRLFTIYTKVFCLFFMEKNKQKNPENLKYFNIHKLHNFHITQRWTGREYLGR